MILGLTFSLADGKLPPLEDWRNLGLISVLAAALCLLYGYLFVGAGAIGYKLLHFLKLIKGESEVSQDASDLGTIP